jgi:hypothetical protein
MDGQEYPNVSSDRNIYYAGRHATDERDGL